MICNKCGSQVSNEMRFCSNCGNDISAQITATSTSNTVQEVQTKVAVEKPVVTSLPKNGNNRILRGFLATLCCILLFVITFTALALLTVRTSIHPERISALIDTINVDDAISDTPIEKLINDTANKKEIEKIFKKGSIKDYVKDAVEDYADFILTGDEPDEISGDDIVSLMEENAELIEETSGFILKERDYKKIANAADDIEDMLYDVRKSSIMDTIQLILSMFIIIGLFALAVIFLLLLILSRKWHYDTMLWSGITFTVTGLLFAALSIGNFIVPGFIPDSFVYLATIYLNSLAKLILISGGILTLTGVVLISAYIITKKAVTARVAKIH